MLIFTDIGQTNYLRKDQIFTLD